MQKNIQTLNFNIRFTPIIYYVSWIKFSSKSFCFYKGTRTLQFEEICTIQCLYDCVCSLLLSVRLTWDLFMKKQNQKSSHNHTWSINYTVTMSVNVTRMHLWAISPMAILFPIKTKSSGNRYWAPLCQLLHLVVECVPASAMRSSKTLPNSADYPLDLHLIKKSYYYCRNKVGQCNCHNYY